MERGKLERGQMEALQRLPAVDLVLKHLEKADGAPAVPRPLLVEGVREAIEALRRDILKASGEEASGVDLAPGAVARKALLLVEKGRARSLKKVINATGTVLHTNLGRSLLAEEALQALAEVAGNYSNLEYNLEEGERGERYDHVQKLLCRLTGAEKALVVNNNAAAVLLALSTLARGKEVVVSRGELVEIGGSFRIPAVMAQSGARLVEVGTTNKTRLEDYREALTAETALLMKVHTSNYRVLGFTEEVPLQDLVALGEERGLPVLEDLGSGVLEDLTPHGLCHEPTVRERIEAGASVVTFSGDKLLGGPQAGILVGRAEVIAAMGKNQLTRALRIDKLTLAALEATLLLYLDPEEALKRVPTLRMLTVPPGELEAGAQILARALQESLGKAARVEVIKEFSAVGGGALPLAKLPTFAVAAAFPGTSTSRLAEKLRSLEPPLLLRVQQDRLLLDPRTLVEGDRELIPGLIGEAMAEAKGV